MKRWVNCSRELKLLPQRIMRLDEASDRGRYLMIGAAERFVDTVRNLALICESDLLGERVARRREFSPRHQPRYTDP